MGILIVSFAFLGFILTREISDYLTQQRVASITESAKRVAHSVEAVFLNVYLHGDLDLDPLGLQIQNLSDLLGASVVILHADYSVMFNGLPVGVFLPGISYIEAILAGETIVVSGVFSHVNNETMLFAGRPIFIGNNVLGAVLVYVSLAEHEATIAVMRQITVISLLVAILFGSGLIYMSSRAMARRLRQMNEAAEIIAGGVFEKRIPATSKDEVGQLAAQFNNMAESLHNQEVVRRAFIANLSHDIRTPLTSIYGFVNAIKDGTAPPERGEYYLDIVLGETDRLIKLSNDLLDMHRIQNNVLELTTTMFDINQLIRAVILGFEQIATQKQISVSSHFASVTNIVLADKDKIQRCLYNLLDNALKFTHSGGEITVETTVKGKKVVVSVKDNGQGMTSQEQAQVFERFFKGDPSRNEDKGGSGLGLSIVNEFIRAHGEVITLESAPKKGSVFAFTLATVEV